MDESDNKKQASALAASVDKYFELTEVIGKLDDALEKVKKERESLNEKLVSDMTEGGLQQLKDAEGRMIYLRKPEVYASINKENEAEAIRMIKEDWGMSDLFKETIHAKALSRIVKERLEANEEVPDNLVKVYLKQKVGHRK